MIFVFAELFSQTMTFSLTLDNEAAMIQLGHDLAQFLKPDSVIFLNGDLGAGKTTLIKGVLKGLGHNELVTSPTYTLVEQFDFAEFEIFHFDLYRMQSADELEMIGIRDMLHESSIALIEWPEKGQGVLPPADSVVDIQFIPGQPGRLVELSGEIAGSLKHFRKDAGILSDTAAC